MSGDQWFQLWMTIVQVVVGGIATLAAVFVGARLALGASRRQAIEDRSRGVAAKLASGLEEAGTALSAFAGNINFVYEGKVSTWEQALNVDIDPSGVAEAAQAAFIPISSEAALLTEPRLRDQASWATSCLIDFALVCTATRFNSDRFSMSDLSDLASKSADYLSKARRSLLLYVRGEEAANLPAPTHLKVAHVVQAELAAGFQLGNQNHGEPGSP